MLTIGWRPAWGPAAFDIALALGVATLYELQMGKGGVAGLVDRSSWPLGLIQSLHALAAFALAARRLAPFASAAGVGVLTLLSPTVAALVAAYSAGAYVAGRRRAWVVITGLAVAFAQPWDYLPDVGEVAGLASMVVAAGMLGTYVGARHRHARELAMQARREQETLAERARAEERTRIAGEMHDLITHRVSLMVLQAGALRTSTADESVRRIAEELRRAGCQTLEELRDLVGVLRAEDQIGTAPAAVPVVPDMSDLVATSRAAGVPVEAHVVGAAAAVSPVIARAAHRVAQEALTNVHKHAPGARVCVEVRHGDGRVRVAVRNTRAVPNPDIRRDGPGTGLAGLRTRVELLGGEFRAGPDPDGGFEVVADLPAVPANPGATR
ncbi:histidine kinase [Actinoplanes sp. NPDC049548]|uniref:sensor histidine kinase n=1 Tax=Actinoplanes sp. NPDC049548 TaxID=3155152 RepID=UPI0034440102